MRDLETSLFPTHISRIWDGQQAGNELKVSCDPLKHCFLEFTQVAFWIGQEKETEFPVIGDLLIHRFLDITKIEFLAC